MITVLVKLNFWRADLYAFSGGCSLASKPLLNFPDLITM
jgi:hypothetical protein